MRKTFFSLALIAAALTIVSCVGRDGSSTPVAKEAAVPVERHTVGVEQMTIATDPDVEWNVDEEVMSGVRAHLGTSKFVDCNFEPEKDNEFLVLMEMVDHEVADESLKAEVKVQVVDMRGEMPQVISEETIEAEHPIPKANHLIDYTQVQWGNSEYVHTPLCIAHARIARTLSGHVEQTIARV